MSQKGIVTGRSETTNLCQVNLIEHDKGCAAIVIHQPPEVLHRVGQRVLSYNEGCWLSVAL
uniref:Uncharacterized protein n=1 Tax=Anguilla anguilla TaxID=7936 RepID=A0A0E9VXV5_ANGAN